MRKVFTIIALLFFFNSLSFGQTTIAFQSFEGGSSDNWNYTETAGQGTIAVSTDRAYEGTHSLKLTGSNKKNSDPFVVFDNIDISGYNNVTLSVAFAANGPDGQDDLYLDISYDNGSTWNGAGSVKLVDGYSNCNINFGETSSSNPTTVSSNPWTVDVSDDETQISVRIRFDERSGKNNTSDHYYVDEIKLTGDEAGSVANPTNFTASAGGTDNIDLSWDKNAAGDNVMIAYNTSDDFGTPDDGTTYSVGDKIGNATVTYNGSGTSYNHSGLSSNTTYYYKAWSVDGSTNYSSGITTNATTTKEEPTNHVSDFTATANGAHRIDISWTENDGAVIPDGYLIIASTGTVTDPTDGTEPDDDTDLNDGNGNVKVDHGTTSYIFTNCSASTTYNFKIYPYTNSGSHIDFKTDGTVPSASATTEEQPVYNLIISEVADPSDNVNARFVELYNTGSTAINFDNEVWYICRQANGGSWASNQLSGSIGSGETYIIATNLNNFNNAYGFNPDLVFGSLTGNGDDGYFLYKDGDNSSGTLVDAYGVIDQDGTGKAWEYTDSRAYRKSTVTQANSTWTESEWVIESADVDNMTPGNYPEIVDSKTISGTGEYDFNSAETGFKMNVSSITGSDNFSARYIKGRGPKHVSGITESHISKFSWHLVKGANITDISADLKFYVSKFPEYSVQEGANDVKLYKRETFGNGAFSLVGTLTYHDNGTQGDQSDDWLEYDGITSFSEFVLASDNEPLPVELISFTANVNDNNVILNWQTATEVNNYGFEIQRSTEKTTWSKIGFVEGNGTSNSPKEYSFTDRVSQSGKYSYRLKQIDIDGSYKYSNVVEVNVGSPEKFELGQNYPNPFNPATTIEYSIPNVGEPVQNVQLIIYDVLGREVATLVNGKQEVGHYKVKFDASKLNSGVYFYTLRAGEFVSTKKMILMK